MILYALFSLKLFVTVFFIFSECDSNSVELGFERVINEDAIKPHERRALNFLIYEYLLQQDCKITSITFSDEVTDQVNF